MSDLREDEPDVLIFRSRLDPSIWLPDVRDTGDRLGFDMAGRLRAVQRWCEETYAQGRMTRWERESDTAWRMRIVPDRKWPERKW
jgi:hypothetical protein